MQCVFSQWQFRTLEALFLRIAAQLPPQLPPALLCASCPETTGRTVAPVDTTATPIMSVLTCFVLHSPHLPSLVTLISRYRFSDLQIQIPSWCVVRSVLCVLGHCFLQSNATFWDYIPRLQKQCFLVKKSIECLRSQLCKGCWRSGESRWGWRARTETLVSEGHWWVVCAEHRWPLACKVLLRASFRQ